MAIKLHKAGYEHAESMIHQGFEIEQISNNWDEVKPTEDEEEIYLENHSLDEYGLWYLGIDDKAPAESQTKFVYPYGDFSLLQESALIIAEQEAKRNHHDDIAAAAKALLTKLDHIKNN